MGQPMDVEDEATAYGVGDDEYYGSIPMNELSYLGDEDLDGTPCPNCGGQQLGYFSDYPDRELIGRYCRACGSGYTGNMGYYGDEEESYGQYPEDDLEAYEPEGEYGPAYGQGPEENDLYGQYPEENDLYGQYPDENDDYGQYPEDDGYGQDVVDEMGIAQEWAADEDMGGMARYEEDLDGFARPMRGGRGGGRFSGYEPERPVNPVCRLRRRVRTMPFVRVPDFFKPYF